ncbi:hypothetical protein PAL_GLEAN10023081 [Pteropus alecto]|uniref:Uncharacterized protein n=1 Tax=Pteropus alecto TaxID=9402 RepID=L5K1R1_PTEAL|nr:hypothetical protein PAL_GLEAN10023081 [Pteropus alecto]
MSESLWEESDLASITRFDPLTIPRSIQAMSYKNVHENEQPTTQLDEETCPRQQLMLNSGLEFAHPVECANPRAQQLRASGTQESKEVNLIAQPTVV